jgi:hypothetical protein
MLGIGRASEYAGWWNQGNKPATVVLTGSSALRYTNAQTPSYSLLTGVGGSPAGQWQVQSEGNYNITGYTGLTGYNANRATVVATVYLDWPTSGIPSSAFVAYNVNLEIKQSATQTEYYSPSIRLSNSNTQFSVDSLLSGYATILPGSYTQYVGKWLTFVWTMSETQSSFTNWSTQQGSSGNYVRTAIYDSLTGALIQKYDFRGIPNFPTDLSVWPNSVPTATYQGDTAVLTTGYGSGPDVNGTYYNTRLNTVWWSIGTMFDPLTTTNTSWRTTRPSATIDTGKAWLNLQLTNYIVDDTGQYAITDSGMGLFSATNNVVVKGPYNSGNNYSADDWAAYQSTTITSNKDTA